MEDSKNVSIKTKVTSHFCQKHNTIHSLILSVFLNILSTSYVIEAANVKQGPISWTIFSS